MRFFWRPEDARAMDGAYPIIRRLTALPAGHCALVAIVAFCLFLTRLSCPLLEPEEARYAEIPREMLAEGRFMEPTWHGEPYYHKPPLLYWLVMASYCVFGVHDWSARLVPAFASISTIMVVWLWSRKALGPRAGLCAAMILALSARFVYLGRMLTFDPLLCLWVVGALASAYLAIGGDRLRWTWWFVSAGSCGLGLLTKGPVAVALVLPPVIAFQVCVRRAGLRLASVVVYVAVASGLVLPWYAAMAWLNPEAAVDFFWLHNFQRYVAPVDHQEPVWFFLPGLLLGTLPWSLLLVPLVRKLCHRGRPRPQALVFCLIALLWCVLFFSLSGCKRVGYILPALPLLSVCLGWCLGEWLPSWRPASLRLGLAGAAVLFVGLLVGVQVLLPRYHRNFALRGQVRRHAEELAATDGVFCYPKRWDSVTFYLQSDQVRVFGAAEKGDLIAALQARSQTLMFVKNEHWLDEFRSALPPSLEFKPIGRQGRTMAVGLVSKR
jgi:4-amino-4-deoxy-L-arabinose transferase-like glycosyltransferase